MKRLCVLGFIEEDIEHEVYGHGFGGDFFNEFVHENEERVHDDIIWDDIMHRQQVLNWYIEQCAREINWAHELEVEQFTNWAAQAKWTQEMENEWKKYGNQRTYGFY